MNGTHEHETEAAMLVEEDRRIEQLLADAEAACGPTAWPRVEALVAALLELYGEGLRRIVASARRAAQDAEALDERLCSDEVVSSLLLLHDLHPIDLARRLERALDRVRREAPHTAPLRVVDVTDGIVELRADDDDAPLPTTAAVARAIEREAPELSGVRIDGAVVAPIREGGLVPAERLVRGGRP